MKTALITGSSSGIGLELAKRFAADSYDLVLVARSEDKLNELAAELRDEFAVEVHVVASDLAKPTAVSELVATLEELELEIDMLVNNAGFGDFGAFTETSLDKMLGMIQVNITSLTALTKMLVPPMVDRGRGRVMNVASTAAFQPGPLMAVYYATKAYVLSFTEAIAEELSGSGVTVTALCPGPTASGFQSVADLGDSKLVKGRSLPTSAEVADAGYDAMMRGRRVFIHGTVNWAIAQSVRFMPRRMVTAAVKQAQAKAS